MPLPTRPDCNRRIECGACISVFARPDDEAGCAPGVSGHAPEDEKRLGEDIFKHGAVVFAEMQQREETVERRGKTEDKLPGRMVAYASSITVRDYGNSQEGMGDRIGKNKKDELSRSVVGVGYMGYGDMCKFDHKVEGDIPGCGGRVFAYVNLRNSSIFSRDKIMNTAAENAARNQGYVGLNEKQKEEAIMVAYTKIVQRLIVAVEHNVASYLSALSSYTKRLASELLAIFSMSHLFTADIVAKFSPVVKKICKILEVNMDTIASPGWSETDAQELIGRFRSLEKERAESIPHHRRRNIARARSRCGTPPRPGPMTGSSTRHTPRCRLPC
jgi:hypothetical protein